MPDQLDDILAAAKPAAPNQIQGGDDPLEGILAAAKPIEKTIGGFAENVGSSFGKFVGDTWNAVTHPVDTVKAVGGIAMGGAQKLIPGEQEDEAKFDAVVQEFKNRYGDVDKVGETIYSDPVGFLADVSSVFGGTGLALKGVRAGAKASGMGRAASAAGTAADVATKVSTVTDPLTAPLRGVAATGKGAIRLADKAGMTVTPERMYRSALKPSVTLPMSKVDDMVDAGLREGIPVSAGGLDKLSGLLDNLNATAKGIIDEGAARGATIDPSRVASRLDDVRTTFRDQVTPQADMATISRVEQEFLGSRTPAPQKPSGILDASGNQVQPPTTGPSPIPIDEAQRIKQGTYTQIRKSYGKLSNAEVESQKALARGLKEEIATVFPEIAHVNERTAKAIGLEEALEKAVRRGQNRQMIGIGTPIVGAGAGIASGSPKLAAIAATIKAVIDDPGVKSRLAIMINRGKQRQVGGRTQQLLEAARTGRTAASRIQAYREELDRLTGEQSEQQAYPVAQR